MTCVGSDSSGILGMAMPPSERNVRDHAWWERYESTEHATTSVFSALNSDTLSLKAISSLGQIRELQTNKKVNIY